MLIKEYHIPLPLTLEEYKIAQLYMIQKKSREESEGTESGVEIIENRPYTDGPFGQGQYTYKVYHIGRHIPGWLRGMVPKTALEVHEESWNAYPRTKTKFSVPFVEKFTLEIDTVFQQDGGTQENIFNLTRAELRNRDVDTIDIVNDSLVGSDYKEEEDPSLYVSDKTGRGPLPDNWITNPPNGVIMCSYKLIKVEFRYWGLQSRIERFIHDYGLRRVMLRAHRQAWAWQDEWVGLTMDDIRRLERETKLILQRKLGKGEGGETEEVEDDEGFGATGGEGTVANKPMSDVAPAPPVKRYSIPASSTTSLPPNSTAPDVEETAFCPLDNIAIHEDSDSEYFDAREDVSDQDTDSDEFLDPTPQSRPHTIDTYHTDDELEEDDTSTPMLPTGPAPHPRSILLLVTLTGGVLNSDIGGAEPDIDLQMMRETFEDVYSKHYQNSLSKVVLKFVLCPKITSGVCDLLQSILPPSSPQGNPNFPLTALPLLLMEDQSYHTSVNSLTERLNTVYCQFKQSEEGVNFSGDVCIVSDSVSSLMIYDILTRPSTPLLSNRANFSSSSNHLDGGSSDEGHSPFSSFRSVSVPTGSKSVPSPRKGGGALDLPGLRGHPSSLLSSLLFNVSKVFTFGSPLGLVLSLKKLRGVPLSRPKCSSLYNLFYAVDPLGFRLEPLLDDTFSSIDPLLIPCYLVYPTGDKSSVALTDFVSYVTTDERKGRGSGQNTSNECLFVLDEELKKSDTSKNDHKAWWGSDRIDYVLQAPNTLEGVVSLPNTSYGHIVQSRYLEAKELASFVLRQVSICKGHGAVSAAAASTRSGFFVPFTPFTSTVKWAKRKTPLRIQKMSPNHRAVDVVIASHSTQLPHLQAKFFYGPLNMATLSGEMVNIFILSSPQEKESISLEENEGEPGDGKKERVWCYLDSASTDKHGRISYPLSPEQVPSAPGVYPLIYLVKGDHTLAISNMFVLPSYTEAVVFSIDGALCSSFSLSGRDMRLKPGALEVTRLWQEQGYLLIYITGRPIFQKEYITSWLTLQGFPLGIVSFSDTLSTDAQNTKLLYLARLMKEARVILCGAYGSVRHLSVYKELGLQPDQIYLHGNNKKSLSSVGKGKSEYQLLSDGFTGHLRSFKLRPAVVNMNTIIGQYKFDYSDIKQSQQHQKSSHRSSTSSLHGPVSGTNE